MLVQLLDFNAKHAQFKLLPRYKVGRNSSRDHLSFVGLVEMMLDSNSNGISSGRLTPSGLSLHGNGIINQFIFYLNPYSLRNISVF